MHEILSFLHTSDLHGCLTENAATTIAELRKDATFYFDCGDCVKAGNISIPRQPEKVWELLRFAHCTAGVPGNREFHISAKGFRAKLKGCSHPMLAANLRWKGKPKNPLLATLENDETPSPLPAVLLRERIGVFGVMVPMVTERMQARRISAFLFDSPIEGAKKCVQKVRREVELLVCLSHIGLEEDIRLAQEVPEIDIIFGGHSHHALEKPERVGKTWICHSGAFADYVGRYVWENSNLRGELIPLVSKR